jgi:hypothetical protein
MPALDHDSITACKVLGSALSSHEAPDAGGLPGACDDTHPGVRVHLTVGFVSNLMTPWWSDGGKALGLVTNGSSLVEYYEFEAPQLDAAYQSTVVLRYPAGTRNGPAGVGFYAIYGAVGNWEGSTDFVANIDGCSDVDLSVKFVALTDADSGL